MRWQRAMRESQVFDLQEEDVTSESYVIFESTRSTLMGKGTTAFPDFGDAICFYRYFRVSDELEPQQP